MPAETSTVSTLRRPSRKFWLAAALTAFFGLPFIGFHGFGAFDAFLKLDGIPGESSDSKHKDEIEVLSYSWGVSNTPTAAGGARKVTVQDFNYTKKIDKSSPVLMLSCATGKHIPTAVITCRKAGVGGAAEHVYLKIELEDLLVSGYSISGQQSDILPTDSFSINFGKITMTYVPQDPITGQPGEPVRATVDFKQLVGQ